MDTLEAENIMIKRETKGRIPNLPFVEIKNDVLGKDYELSVLFPKIEKSRELHKKWKKKDDPVNILSFPLDEKVGEIIITLSKARQEAKNYGRSYRNHLIFLFIHGCLHLKGMVHGAKMEREENFYYKKYAE